MAFYKKMTILTLGILMIASCSVMPENIRKEAQTQPPFAALRDNPREFVGKTVILGGHILQTTNLANETRIAVLQTPLGFEDSPEDVDSSEGRFMISYDGFLDPEVYAKDRLVTVGGEVMGSVRSEDQNMTYDYPLIKASHVYLWPKRDYNYGPYYDPWFYGPYPYFYPYYYPFPYYYYR